MKIKKIIASDIDGTLLPYYQEFVDPRTFEIIKKLETKGVLFVPASGRTIHSLKDLFHPLKEQMSFLSENGGVVWHEGEEIVETPIPRDLLKEILETIYNAPNQEAYINSPTRGYVVANDKEYGKEINKIFGEFSQMVDSLDEINDTPVKITAMFRNDDTQKYFQDYLEKFGDRINVMMAGPNVIDFGVANKGYGLKILAEYYGLTPEDIYAFGDNYNDLSMLEYAGESYMMDTDDPIRLKAAKHVCTNVVDELEKIYESL